MAQVPPPGGNQSFSSAGPTPTTDNTSQTAQQFVYRPYETQLSPSPGQLNNLGGPQFVDGYLTRGQVLSLTNTTFNHLSVATRRNSLRKVVPVIPLGNIGVFTGLASNKG